MKLKTLAAAVAAAAVLSAVSVPVNAGLANQGYVGIRGGYAWTMNEDTDLTVEGLEVGNLIDDSTDGWNVGLYGGYNFTNWFSLELGFNYWDGFDLKAKGEAAAAGEQDFKIWGPELALRFAYTFDENGSDIFLRGGVAFLTTDYDHSDVDDHSWAPFIGIGAQYAFTRNFAIRAGLDYYWNAVHTREDGTDDGVNFNLRHDSDLLSAYIGFQFQFGGPAAAPVPVPTATTKNINLNADALFPFDGATLSDVGRNEIARVVSEAAPLTNVTYELDGYTDRLGSDAYNQRLSERRANAVAAELSNQGVANSQIISVTGHGKANPVTQGNCQQKNRRELIKCLAPDRRVEVTIKGDELK